MLPPGQARRRASVRQLQNPHRRDQGVSHPRRIRHMANARSTARRNAQISARRAKNDSNRASCETNIPQSTIANVIAGCRQLSKPNVLALAKFFGMSPTLFMGSPGGSVRLRSPSPWLSSGPLAIQAKRRPCHHLRRCDRHVAWCVSEYRIPTEALER